MVSTQERFILMVHVRYSFWENDENEIKYILNFSNLFEMKWNEIQCILGEYI